MANAGRGAVKARRRAPLAIGDYLDYLRQHPVASVALAVALGAAGLAMRGAQLARTSPAGANAKMNGKGRRRTHDVGAADMEFSARRPGRKNILFRFAWKKRPVDAPDADWPVDTMGFAAAHPNGRYTAFRFTRKTRPVPAARTGESRPGLGQAEMEFVSSRPGRKDFRFTWSKVPPNATERKGEDHGKEKRPAAAPRRPGRRERA